MPVTQAQVQIEPEREPSIADLQDIDIKDKVGIIRAATDVLDKKGNIKSDKRIRVLIPTVEAAFKRGAKYLVLGAYFGRPDKDDENKDARYKGVLYDNLKSGLPIAQKLEELTGRKVHFISAVVESGEFFKDYKDYFNHVEKKLSF